MMYHRVSIFTSVIIGFVLITGCSLFPAEALPSLPGGGQASGVLFFDDFASDAIGAVPTGWNKSGQGIVEVIEDEDSESKKAVRIRMRTEDTAGTHLKGPKWDTGDSEPEIIVLEFIIKKIEGTSAHVYISSEESDLIHHIDINVSPEGVLRFREGGSNKDIVSLDEGWNRVRVIADRKKETATVYVNDMTEPAQNPFAEFRTPVETWNNTFVYMMHPRNQGNKGNPSEIHYGEFIVMVGDSE